MPTAIDGSNLGGYLGGRQGSRDRAEVLRRLMPWARTRRRAVVVFDGPDDGSLALGYGSLEVCWSDSRSADDVLIALVRRKPKDWKVITDDSALAVACKNLGATSESVARFLERLPSDEPHTTDARVDVEDWESWFRAGGVDDP